MGELPKDAAPKRDFIHTLAAGIVNMRYLIFLLFAAAAVYCVLGIGKVRVNSDLTSFLPAQTETRQGITVMEAEFQTFGSAQIMVSNVTLEDALSLVDQIAQTEHVTDVVFDDSQQHYKHAAALFSVSFDGAEDDAAVVSAMAQIRSLLAPYDTAYSSSIGVDYSSQLASEMGLVMALAVAVIVAVLLFTSRSYFEVVIFGIVFVFAALLNMGTNFWLGEVSSITNSVAVILQLALAIDYAIIFAHRYQDEVPRFDTAKEALVEALAKSIVEISSSSLTTISGLVALTMMQFRLGYDMGIVLAKGILCSMLTVFLLMPGLILLFPRAIRRTTHRPLIPNIEGWGRFLARRRALFLILLALLLPVSIYCSSRAQYAFSDSSISELIYSEERAAVHKINDSFDPSTAVAVLVPAGDYEKEKTVLQQMEALEAVKSATGLANIEIEPGHVLTDAYSPRMFSELLGIDIEQARLLFQAYGVEHQEYQAIFGKDYRVPLLDLFLYLFEKIDQGAVQLDETQTQTLSELRGSLERGVAQLRGTNWDRLVLTAAVPAEGEQSLALVEQVRAIAQAQYGEDTVLMIGDITSARDLRESYQGDSVLINVLTIGFVFLILLFTFRSPVAAAVLVFVIQSSIWINFSIPYLLGLTASFVTNMIVSAIQMGATIDYAIVILSRYLALRREHPKRHAMILAVNESFPTVLTSGAIMSVAGFLIGFLVSDVYVGHIGFAVGRGALISVLLVLSALPQLIVLCDRAIEKTTFRLSPEEGGAGK